MFRQVDYVRQTINLPSKDSELLDTNIRKSLCFEFECIEVRAVERVFGEEDNTYIIIEGDRTGKVTAIVPVFSVFDVQLSYTKIGTIELNTLVSEDRDIDTSNIVGVDYLRDFIEAYQAIIPNESAFQSFACLTPTSEFLNTDWNRADTNESLGRPETLLLASDFRALRPEKIVRTPGACPNNSA